MHYYIDGYNLIFRVLKAGDDLQAQRQQIIQELNTKIQLLGLNATLVFDAHYRYGDEYRTHYKHLEILFTAEGMTADEYILHVLKRASSPAEFTVVTSDRKLAWLVRLKQAHTQSVDEFLGWLNKRYKNKLKRLKEPQKAPKITSPIKLPKVATPSTPEESFDYYLQQFEERFHQLSKEVSPKPEKKTSLPKSYKKQVHPPKNPPTDTRSDYERWLEEFTKD